MAFSSLFLTITGGASKTAFLVLTPHFTQFCVSFGVGSNVLNSHYAFIDAGLETAQVMDVHESQGLPSIVQYRITCLKAKISLKDGVSLAL